MEQIQQIEEALERLERATNHSDRNFANGYCSGLLNGLMCAGLISPEEWSAFCRRQNKAMAHAQTHGAVAA